jgi:hypothetical protein
MESIEELLKPRFKVIADYPGAAYTIGHIYEGDLFDDTIIKLSQFPHLFKKMEWWEERKPEEIEYIKRNSCNSGAMWVGKILEIKGDRFKCILQNGETMVGKFTPNQDMPATRAEYDQQRIQNKRSA